MTHKTQKIHWFNGVTSVGQSFFFKVMYYNNYLRYLLWKVIYYITFAGLAFYINIFYYYL